MSVVVKNKDKVLKRLNNIGKMDLKEAMTKATSLVHGQAIELCPSSDGTLKQSIHMDIREEKDTTSGIVATNCEYAIYVEYGTGQLAVGTYPDPSKSLTYTTKPYWRYQDKKGNWHTTKGHVAQPFMYNSLEMHKNDIKKILGDEVHSIVKGR